MSSSEQKSYIRCGPHRRAVPRFSVLVQSHLVVTQVFLFLVAEGSTLICYDSQYSPILTSSEMLFHGGPSCRIARVFSVGSVRESGILASTVLLFKDSL